MIYKRAQGLAQCPRLFGALLPSSMSLQQSKRRAESYMCIGLMENNRRFISSKFLDEINGTFQIPVDSLLTPTQR
jgi:hypothetical protein